MAERQDNDGIDPQERPEPDVPDKDTGQADADLDDLDTFGHVQVEPEDHEEDSDPGLPQVVTRRHDGRRVDVDLQSGSESSLAAAVVSSVSDDDPLIGHKFGGFEITERIGHGGMGTVYKGQQVSLDREVAIKILNAQLVDNEEFIRRFQREAKSIARISHPNIVAVHDFGESDGHYYMVIEYVKGTNLSRMIAERLVLTPEEFVPILLQCLDGLEHVAKSGIVHRDIKPDNILIDEHGIAKLADFGLAKSMDANQQDTDLTAHGSAMGTPAYMSPEQCMGRHLDIRSDIYALGVTAYLALTGEKPFTGQSSFEIMTKHREHVPPSPGQLNPQLPQAVSDAIMQMLAKEPRDRCDTIADMHERWTKIAEGLGIRTGHRSGEWVAPDPFAMQPDPIPIALDEGPYGPESAVPDPGVPEPMPPAMLPEIDLGPAPLPPPSAGLVAHLSDDGEDEHERPEGAGGGASSGYRRTSSHLERPENPPSRGIERTYSSESIEAPQSGVGSAIRDRRRGGNAVATQTCPSCGMLNHANDTHCQRCGFELVDPKSLNFADRQQRADELFAKKRWKEAAAAFGRLAESVTDRRQRSVLRSKEREARCNYEEQVYESLSSRSQELLEKGDFQGGIALLERSLHDSMASPTLSARLSSDLTTMRHRRRRQRRRKQLLLGVIVVLAGLVGLFWYAQGASPEFREQVPEWLRRSVPPADASSTGEVHP